MKTSSSLSSHGPRRGSLLVIFVTVFIDLLGFGIVLPLLPIYGKHFAEVHGLTTAQTGWVVGLLMSSFSAMQFLFLPFWGRLSDRFGRRPILLVGLAGSVIFYTLFGLAALWQSLAWLFVARIGAGIAGATISTAQAYIADTTSADRRTAGMALIGAAFALGFTVGPIIGAVSLFVGRQTLLSPWPGYVAAGLSAGAWLLAFWKLPESLSAETRRKHWTLWDTSGWQTALATPSIGLLLLTSFIAVSSFASYESTLSLEVKMLSDQLAQGLGAGGMLDHLVHAVRRFGYANKSDVELAVVLLTFTYLGIVLTVSQGFLVRRMAGRLQEGTMGFGGLLISVGGFSMLSLAVARASFGLLCVAVAIIVIGFSFVTPSIQSLISRRTSPQNQGHVLGVAQSVSSLARIFGPVIGIRLFAAAPVLPYWVATGVMGLALTLIVVAAKSGRDYVAS